MSLIVPSRNHMCSVPPGHVNVLAALEPRDDKHAAWLEYRVAVPGALVTVAPAAVPINQPYVASWSQFTIQMLRLQLHAIHPPVHLILYEPAGNEVTTGNLTTEPTCGATNVIQALVGRAVRVRVRVLAGVTVLVRVRVRVPVMEGVSERVLVAVTVRFRDGVAELVVEFVLVAVSELVLVEVIDLVPVRV